MQVLALPYKFHSCHIFDLHLSYIYYKCINKSLSNIEGGRYMTGNKIKEFREAAGMSQVELARRARMASTNLSAIECGRLAPWPKAKRALARVLKCSQAELFPEEQSGGDAN